MSDGAADYFGVTCGMFVQKIISSGLCLLREVFAAMHVVFSVIKIGCRGNGAFCFCAYHSLTRRSISNKCVCA